MQNNSFPTPSPPPQRLIPGPEGTPSRADKWLSEQFPEVSRSQMHPWFREGRVRRDGRVLKPGEEVRAGQVIEVDVPASEPVISAARAEDLPLEILHEDAAVIAVNKPAGLVVHPAPGHAGGTLVNALLHRFPDLAGVGNPLRPGLVHRLDADTSGVIVFARTAEALAGLQRQFKERLTHKEYQCLIRGVPPRATGEIDLPLGRHPKDRKRRAVNGEGARPAFTRYTMLEGLASGTASRMRVEIETGRTHQIRVHLAHIGHPVLGDRVYGGRNFQLGGGWPDAPRQMLHAFRLRFLHPVDNVPLELEAPLPDDMTTLLSQLKAPRTP